MRESYSAYILNLVYFLKNNYYQLCYFTFLKVYFMCRPVWSPWVICTTCVPGKSEDNIDSPGTRTKDGWLGTTMWMWELNLGSLQGQ